LEENKNFIFAKTDEDWCIRLAPPLKGDKDTSKKVSSKRKENPTTSSSSSIATRPAVITPRFAIGTRVECNMGPDGWMPGRIYRHHYVEDGWHHPSDFVAPYQVSVPVTVAVAVTVTVTATATVTVTVIWEHSKRSYATVWCVSISSPLLTHLYSSPFIYPSHLLQVELETEGLENPYIYAQTDQDWCIRLAPKGIKKAGAGCHKTSTKAKGAKEEPFCGLCGSRRGPFMLTECCGRRLCDTEGEYEMGSYERDGQCARNHRLNTICGYHHNEGHEGEWKSCKTCEGDFHPFDYAVKATSMKVACTERKYNFEDNVRGDLFPQSMCFPQCDVCGVPVDTTEETTRTLSMRRMSGQPPLCEQHGGGFGVIKPSAEGCKQS
jgi:hypothetical protein